MRSNTTVGFGAMVWYLQPTDNCSCNYLYIKKKIITEYMHPNTTVNKAPPVLHYFSFDDKSNSPSREFLFVFWMQLVKVRG